MILWQAHNTSVVIYAILFIVNRSACNTWGSFWILHVLYAHRPNNALFHVNKNKYCAYLNSEFISTSNWHHDKMTHFHVDSQSSCINSASIDLWIIFTTRTNFMKQKLHYWWSKHTELLYHEGLSEWAVMPRKDILSSVSSNCHLPMTIWRGNRHFILPVLRYGVEQGAMRWRNHLSILQNCMHHIPDNGPIKLNIMFCTLLCYIMCLLIFQIPFSFHPLRCKSIESLRMSPCS